jgi:hypothetical protein
MQFSPQKNKNLNPDEIYFVVSMLGNVTNKGNIKEVDIE